MRWWRKIRVKTKWNYEMIKRMTHITHTNINTCVYLCPLHHYSPRVVCVPYRRLRSPTTPSDTRRQQSIVWSRWTWPGSISCRAVYAYRATSATWVLAVVPPLYMWDVCGQFRAKPCSMVPVLLQFHWPKFFSFNLVCGFVIV